MTSALEHLDDLRWRTIRRHRARVPEEEKKGVRIFRHDYSGLGSFLNGFSYALAFRSGIPFLSHAAYRRFQWSFYHAAKIEKRLKAFQPDVLFCNPFTEYQTDIASRLKRRMGVPVAYHLSLHIDRHLFPKKELMRLEEFDVLMTNTEWERAYLVGIGLDPRKIVVVGATFDVERYLTEEDPEPDVVEKLKDKKFILFFGRREKGKGAEDLIGAFDKISSRYPDVFLVLAGSTTAYFDQQCLARVRERPRILLWNKVSEGSKKWLYRHAFVYSMVSNIDSFGLVYFEAWFRGCPVIGADVGAMRDVIQDGIDGRLVPYGDTDALAKVLADLIERPDEARRMGEAGRLKAQSILGGQAVEKKILKNLWSISRRTS